jgi:hypothetical protein
MHHFSVIQDPLVKGCKAALLILVTANKARKASFFSFAGTVLKCPIFYHV